MNLLARAAQMSAPSTDVAKLFDDDDDAHSMAIHYPAYKPMRADEVTAAQTSAFRSAHQRSASEQMTRTAAATTAAAAAGPPLSAAPPSTYTFATATMARAAASANAPLTQPAPAPAPTPSPPPPPVELQLASGSSLASLAATNGGSATGPLRVPLLEEEIRLLRQSVTDISAQKENYKAQIYALEKKLIDWREEARDCSERLEARESTMEDWKYRDGQMQMAAAQREQDWNTRMAVKEAELAAATRKVHEQEDALYLERTALAELRVESAASLQHEQQYRAQLEEQLKKQIRGVCIERNELAAQLQERTDDLAAAQKAAKALAEDKAQLFEQLTAQSRIGPDHAPQRECRSAEAALLELQKKEIDTLRSRVDELNEEHAARLTALRVELRASVSNECVQRDKVAELKCALKKCMQAMDEQSHEIEQERRQLDKQRKEQRTSSEDQQAHAPEEGAQQQAQEQSEATAAVVPVAAPPPVAASSLPATAVPISAPPASAAFHTLSSQAALAQTRLILEQEQTAAEQRRQRREERRAAINQDEPSTERKEAETPATVATAVALPAAQTPAPEPLPVPSAAAVEALTSRAPVVISAQPPPAPAPVVAPPVSAPVYEQPTLLSGAPVLFDFSFMNSDMPRRPFTEVTLDAARQAPVARGVLHATESDADSFEDAADAQMRAALDHAMREAENDHRARHGEQMLPSAQHRYTTTLGTQKQPPRPRESTSAEDRATLEYAFAQIARMQQRQAEQDEAEAELRNSRPAGGAARKSLSAQAASAARLSGTNKIAAAAPASRAASIKKRSSLTTPASAIGQRRATSSHSLSHPIVLDSSAPVYTPAPEILQALGLEEELPPDVGSGHGAARTPGSMAPLRHVIPTGHPAVPRLHFPQPLSPQQQRRQAGMHADKRAASASRPTSAGRSTFGSGRESSKPQPDATNDSHGALGKVTSSLRKVAASLKKHKQQR